MLQKIRNYFSHGLWEFSLKEKKGWNRFVFKSLRIAVLSIKKFFLDQCTLRASSLTFYTLISIVPLLAMALAISQGFGYRDYLKEQLLQRFSDNREALTQILVFSERLLDQAKGGVLAGAGILLLFWSVTSLLVSMERSLNHIWEIRQLRSWRRFLSDYFTLILIGPLLFIIANSLSLIAAQFFKQSIHTILGQSLFAHFAFILVQSISFILFWGLYTLLYYLLPNARVKISSAFLGGFIAATLYLIVQQGYIYFQTVMTQYNAVYGSFAALPLFLIWVQANWFLLLLGAEISFACQTHKNQEYAATSEKLSQEFQLLIGIWITQIAVERFIHKKPPITIELLMNGYHLPYSIAEPLLQELVEAGILAALKENRAYLPNRDIQTLRISDVIEALQSQGIPQFSWPPTDALHQIEDALHAFRKEISCSSQNRFLKDL